MCIIKHKDMKKIQFFLFAILLTTTTLTASTIDNVQLMTDHDSLFRNFKTKLLPTSISHQSAILNDIAAAIQIMPNPIKNSLFIKIDGGVMGKMEIRLIDWHGHISKYIEIDKTTPIKQQIIQMNDVPKGAYTLEIKQDEAYAYKKIIKK